jgi:hypothetical protein
MLTIKAIATAIVGRDYGNNRKPFDESARIW